MLHDTFVQAYGSVDGSRSQGLKGWLSTVAVTPRAVQPAPQDPPLAPLWIRSSAEEAAPVAEPTTREACSVRSHLDEPADERIAFSLRFIDGMELTEAASACGCSLATIKRRLAKRRAGYRGGAW